MLYIQQTRLEKCVFLFAKFDFLKINVLMLWLSFFCRSLASACISASVVADGSCFITKSELLPVVPPFAPPPYVPSNFNESASELDSNDKISSNRSSAYHFIKEKKKNTQNEIIRRNKIDEMIMNRDDELKNISIFKFHDDSHETTTMTKRHNAKAFEHI